MNKNYLLIVFLFLSSLIYAQDLTQEVDYQLQYLNKSYITTDILYDRVFPLARLDEFNHSTPDTSNVNHYFQAYHELQKADYLSRWTDLDALKQTIANYADKVPIGIINVDFEYIDEAAIQDNLIDLQGTDSLLVDVSNRSRSPYLKKNALVISTLNMFTDSKTVTFKFNNVFNLIAANKSIQSVQVDFKNGQGYQSINLNSEQTITYANLGIYDLKFKVTFNDNSVKYTYCKLEVSSNQKPRLGKSSVLANKQRSKSQKCYGSEIIATRGFQGYDESYEYHGVGEFQVYKGGNDYDKPVIVLDGFDPFQGSENEVGLHNIYYDFLKHSGNQNIGDDLRTQGYDIIPLNFLRVQADDGKIINGGTDYIERNAMVLVELIERINTSDCWESTIEPIKIIGFSMGGLIARYALNYMEDNNLTHNTDLFISVDTPHNGAVVPMGVQEMVDFVDDVANIDVADKVLRSPAAKQMLVHHYLSNSNSPAGAPGFHNNFYNAINSMGFPQNTRNIAIVNGTSLGTKINDENERFFDAEIETGALFPLIGVAAEAKMNFSPPGGQTKKVFDFKGKMRFLGFYITLYRRYKNVSSSSIYGSLENSPGGYFTVEKEINSFLGPDGTFNTNQTLLTSLIFQAKLEITTPEFSFIPAKSALAYSGNNEFLYDDFSNRNLVCTGETPFDSYFTSSNNNEPHIYLSSSKASFIEDEINGIQRNPNVQVSSDQITGPETICEDNVVYTMAQCGAQVQNWSVSSNLLIVNQNSSYITVKPSNSSVNDSGFIRAHFNGQPYITKNIFIGKPKVSIAPLNSNAPYNQAWTNATGSGTDLSDQGISSFPTYTVISQTGTNNLSVLIQKISDDNYSIKGIGQDNNWYLTIDVTFKNGCGNTVKRINLTPPPQEPCSYNIQSVNNGQYNTFAILPPPDDPCSSSTTYSVASLNSTEIKNKRADLYPKKSDKSKYKIEVYNLNGVKVMETEENEINISRLKPDLYIIKGYRDNQIFTKKISKI